jgi:hypothetical protein
MGQLREKLARGETDLLVFLGAGLSYGVATQRGTFEIPSYEIGAKFPSWHLLMRRMLERLKALPHLSPFHEELDSFFQEQGPLDCAELFRNEIGDQNYVEFLREQFAVELNDRTPLSRSHEELVALPVSLLFTTNYDELIEFAFQRAGVSVRVSADPEEFAVNQREKPDRHVVKVHGTISRPSTIVLTRRDYAESRQNRAELLRVLATELRYSTFLFVGFSLFDPNFNLLWDEARLALGAAMPTSYVVQGSPNAVKEAYLRAMGANTISLDWWEDLPQFLRAINPSR